MEARLCILKFDAMYQYEDFKITGVLAATGNLMLEQLRGINYTVVHESAMGTMTDEKTQQYDGCIGSLQKNETDFIGTVGLLTVPVVGPNLTHTVVDGFEKMGILSAYNRANVTDGSRTQVLDMVFSFSRGLWILLAFSYMVLVLLLHASSDVRGDKRHTKYISRFWKRNRVLLLEKHERQKSASHSSKSAWTVVACILKQHSSCSSCHVKFGPIRILYTLITLLSFFTGYYLMSMIKTDMLVVKPPITITTYDEVIESGRRPLWCTLLTEKSEFEHAATGSKEKRIWDIAVAKGLSESFVQSTMDSVFFHAFDFARLKEVVFFNRQMGSKFVPHAGCAYSRTKSILTSVNVLYRHDPSAAETLKGNIDNHLVSSQVSKKRNKRIQWTFEAGLLDITFNRFTDISFYVSLAEAERSFRSIDDCSSNVVTIPYPELGPVHFYHFLSLSILILIAFLFSFIIRLTENPIIHESLSAYWHGKCETRNTRTLHSDGD